jgi:hypothetical protein
MPPPAGAVAAEHQVGVTVDQARRYPRPFERFDRLRTAAGQLGAAADAQDPPALDRDRAVLDRTERTRLLRVHRRDVAVDQQPVPHGSPLRRKPPRDKV